MAGRNYDLASNLQFFSRNFAKVLSEIYKYFTIKMISYISARKI